MRPDAIAGDEAVAPFEFDLTNPALATDPEPIYAELRRSGGTYFDERSGWWHTFKYDDVLGVLREPTGSGRWAAMQDVRLGRDAQNEPYIHAFRNFVDFTEGDDHRRIRAAISRHFRPGRVEALRPGMEERAHKLIDGFAGDLSVELMEAFARKVPVGTISDLLGVDPAHRDTLVDQLLYFRMAFVLAPMTPSQLEAMNSGMATIVDFFEKLIAERRQNPGDDLLSMLIKEADEGKLSDNELLANTWGLFAGGFDSTSNAIVRGMIVLLQHPDQLALLTADWSLLPGAVDEILRFVAPQPNLRIFPIEIEVGGHVIAPDTPVVIHRQSANFDEDWIENPEVFDIRREPTSHLGFAEGVHKCLGLHLARATMGVAFQSLFTRLEGLRIADPEIQWAYDFLPIKAATALNLEWDAVLPRPSR